MSSAAASSLLQLVPIDQIARGEDRFRCHPYRCTITAAGCVGRQQRVAEMGSAAARTGGMAWCIDCADGSAVAARVGVDIAGGGRCRSDACDRTRVDGLDVCDVHRRASRIAKPTPPPAKKSLPAPAPESTRKPMDKTCTRPGCSRPQWGGDALHGSLCVEHARGAKKAATDAEKRAGTTQPAKAPRLAPTTKPYPTREEPSAPPRRGPGRPRKVEVPAAYRPTLSTTAPGDVSLAGALEAVELVAAIGVEVCRQLAARIRGAA